MRHRGFFQARSRRRVLLAVLLLLLGGLVLADPFDFFGGNDDEARRRAPPELSERSQRLIDELAKQKSWDAVAAGLVGAEWFLYNRPGSIGQSGGSPAHGMNSLAGKAASKAMVNAGYAYVESQTGKAPPSSFDAASSALVLKNKYQRATIRTYVTYHKNEIPKAEAGFWLWYSEEFIPGYHDLYDKPDSGNAHGDPHLTTLDGLSIGFQAVGEFVLLRSSEGGFAIQTRHEPYEDSETVSIITAVALSASGQRLVFESSNSDAARVNGNSVDMTPTLHVVSEAVSFFREDGVLYVFDNSTGLLVISSWSHNFGMALDIGLPTHFQHRVQGLFGDYDGESSNDLRLSDGRILAPEHAQQDALAPDPLYAQFANAWRIAQAGSLFDYPEGKTTEDYTDLDFPRRSVDLARYPEKARRRAVAVCREAGVPEGGLRKDCIYDLLVTGDRRFALSAAMLSGSPPPVSEAGYFTRLDYCLGLPCDQKDRPVCSELDWLECEVRWPERGSRSMLCVEPLGRCERDDQCCGYQACQDGHCNYRQLGERCVATRFCDGALLCSREKPGRCYYP